MNAFKRTTVGLAVAAAMSLSAAHAQVSDNLIKIYLTTLVSGCFFISIPNVLCKQLFAKRCRN